MGGENMNNFKSGVKFAVLFFSFAVVTAGRAGAQVHSWDYYYNKAAYRQSQGDYAGAINDLNTALKLSPDNVAIYNTRGNIYEKFGDYMSAMADYEYALSIYPSSAEAQHNIRNLTNKMRGGGSAAQIVSGQEPVRLQTNTQSAASSYTQSGRLPASAMASGVASYPQSGRLPASSIASGAASYTQTGQLPASSYPQSGRLPASAAPSGGYSANSAYGQTSEYQNATKWTAANQLPYGNFTSGNTAGQFSANVAYGGTPSPYTGETTIRYQYPASTSQPPLSAVGNMAGRYSNAPAFATPIQKVFIDPVAETYNSYGVTLSGYGLYDEAILQFNEAIKTYSNYAIAYNNRGLAFAGKGDWASASADFDQALRINPYYYDAQFNRACVSNMPVKR
jgi:tetratricopeptide (TPR) repeat protein